MDSEIDGVIEDVNNNLKLLKEAEQINLIDCKALLTTIFKVLADLFGRFKYMFDQFDKIMEIEQTAEKGEKSEEKPENIDIKMMYL